MRLPAELPARPAWSLAVRFIDEGNPGRPQRLLARGWNLRAARARLSCVFLVLGHNVQATLT